MGWGSGCGVGWDGFALVNQKSVDKPTSAAVDIGESRYRRGRVRCVRVPNERR